MCFRSQAGLSLETVEEAADSCPERVDAMDAVDNCPGSMDAADAEAARPPRIETAVEFWSGTEVETVERMHAMRFFWCTRKESKQKQEAAG